MLIIEKALQIVLALLVFLIPFGVGGLFLKKGKKATIYDLMNGAILGQMLLWAAFQVFAVPLVRLKAHFSLLFWVYTVTMVFLTICGILNMRKHSFSFHIPLPKAPVMWIVLALALGIILFQIGYYVFGMHLDEDDARWIPEAGDALIKDRMYLHNPATGDYLGDFRGDMVRDSYSPLSMYIATLCRLTMTRPAVMAHTIFAPMMLLLSYMIFTRMGKMIFHGTDERIIFIMSVAVIMLFYYGNSDTEAAFSLIRIWQGKAIVAGVIIPLIFSQVMLIQKEDTIINWLILSMIGCGASLLSGMGMIISLIMIGGYGFYIIVCGKWRRIPLWVLSLVPCGVFFLFSQILN